MLKIFDSLRDITFFSMLFRLILAALCSGIIGLERASKNRPAGLRTHILVCIAAAITSMTGHFLYLNLSLPSDPTRMGAQIISGLGFLGAGTIIVTSRHVVKGLTTASSLWASGIIGLVIGAGFYEGGIAASVLVFLVLMFFSGAGYSDPYIPDITLAISYDRKTALDSVELYFERKGIPITYINVTGDALKEPRYKAVISYRPKRSIKTEDIIQHILSLADVLTVCRVEQEDM